jgi:hypothetical protein
MSDDVALLKMKCSCGQMVGITDTQIEELFGFRLEEFAVMKEALRTILLMAQRSDAHPDLQFEQIARKGLGIE